jgi:hypothetical protein
VLGQAFTGEIMGYAVLGVDARSVGTAGVTDRVQDARRATDDLGVFGVWESRRGSPCGDFFATPW